MPDNCTGAYATAQEFVELWRADSVDLTDPDQLNEIETALEFSASNVAQAVSAQGACECTLPSWAEEFLKKLNVIDAAVVFKVSCGPALSDTLRETYLTWLEEQYERIRTLQIDLCGEAGANFPAFGSLQVTHTEFDAVNQVINRILKGT